MRPALTFTLAVALLAGCGTPLAPGSSLNTTRPANPHTPTVALGQPLTVTRTMFGHTVVATITVTGLRVVASRNGIHTPARGQFIAVDVAVEVTEGRFTLAAASFHLVAADGRVFDTTLPVAEPALRYTDLAAGQHTSGAVTFDVAPAAEVGGRVVLVDVFGGDTDIGYWTI